MKESRKLRQALPGKTLTWKSFVPGILRATYPDYFKWKNRTTRAVHGHDIFAAPNKSSAMKNKTFDLRLRKSDGEFQKSPFKIIFFSVKKRKKSLTIKDVFYESVNFRWDEFDNELS